MKNVTQRKLEEDSADDAAIAAAMIEGHVSALSGMNIKMIAQDLQKWTIAYKEDKGHLATYLKLPQGQKYQDFYLTPSGLMARMVGVNRRSLFLSLCNNKF